MRFIGLKLFANIPALIENPEIPVGPQDFIGPMIKEIMTIFNKFRVEQECQKCNAVSSQYPRDFGCPGMERDRLQYPSGINSVKMAVLERKIFRCPYRKTYIMGIRYTFCFFDSDF